MVSVLRTLQAEWNELVPLARARGIPRVRLLNAPLETIAYRREKLEWLRRQLGQTSAMTSSQEIRTSAAVQIDMPEDLTFGLEIEAILPPGVRRETLAAQLTSAGVRCTSELYNHTLRTTWKVLTDGSLGNYNEGFELVSPVLRGPAAVEEIRIVCRVLSSLRVKVNRRCGFHVHVGARDQGVQFFRNLANLYHSAQETIDTFMSPSRRGHANTYARPIRMSPQTMTAPTVDDVVLSVGQTPGLSNSRDRARYSKLNFMSYYQHGTVEFRHHQGTVEFDKIINWTKFCLRMVDAARKGTQFSRTDLPSILEALEAKQDEKEYFVRRANFFARHDNRPTIPLESIRVPEAASSLSSQVEVTEDQPQSQPTPVVNRSGNALAQRQSRAAARRALDEAIRQDRERRLSEMNPFERHGEEAEEASHSRFLPPNWR